MFTWKGIMIIVLDLYLDLVEVKRKNFYEQQLRCNLADAKPPTS